MFVLIMLHVPIGVAMGAGGPDRLRHPVRVSALAMSLFGTEPIGILANPDLAVMPLFLLMGSLASRQRAVWRHLQAGLCAGRASARRARLRDHCRLRGIRRGVRLVAGDGRDHGAHRASGNADRAAIRRSIASGCIAAGGTLGMLIPPSIIIVIYGFIAREFVITLFIAALIPAVIAVTRLHPDHPTVWSKSIPPGARRPAPTRGASAAQRRACNPGAPCC